MSEEKRPLHEVISSKLVTATMGVGTEHQANSPIVYEFLDSLRQGKMKAADAHMLAERHAELPVQLKDAGQVMLAKFAEEVVLDLQGREDEKKQERREVVDTVVHG
jgi:hypothetical protein